MGNLSDVQREGVTERSADFEIIPDGSFLLAILTAQEVKDNSKSTGKVLHAEFTIMEEGKFASRKIRHYFNIQNKNLTAQNIGLGTLKRFAISAGFDDIPDDGSDLLDKPIILKICVEEGNGSDPQTGKPYGPKNIIKDWLPRTKKESVKKTETATDDKPSWM